MSISPLAAQSWIRRYTRDGRAYGNYFGFYRLPEDPELVRVPLNTRDKRIATSRLKDHITRDHEVRNGLRPSDERLEAAKRPISQWVALYLKQRAGEGLSKGYYKKIAERLDELARAVPWTKPADVSAPSFKAWRAERSDLSPKTRNDYLAIARQFAAWLVEQGALESNPLRDVQNLKTKGKQTRPRRPLTADEFQRLLDATPKANRKRIYLCAAMTGARVGEITQLRWDDVRKLDDCTVLLFHPEDTKNAEPAAIPIPAWLADEVASWRSSTAADSDKIFPKGMGHHSFDADLERAGIPKHDARGRSACLHGLRHMYNQMLQENGASLRIAQALMRHKDPKLTANTYLDESRLQKAEAVNRLPEFNLGACTPECTPQRDAEGRFVSQSVATVSDANHSETPENQGVWRAPTPDVASCRTPPKQWSRGDSNPRPETVSKKPLRVYSAVSSRPQDGNGHPSLRPSRREPPRW